jgi:hypothetical protein
MERYNIITIAQNNGRIALLNQLLQESSIFAVVIFIGRESFKSSGLTKVAKGQSIIESSFRPHACLQIVDECLRMFTNPSTNSRIVNQARIVRGGLYCIVSNLARIVSIKSSFI